jgi:hypothetical protein
VSAREDFEPLETERTFDAIEARLRGPAPAARVRVRQAVHGRLVAREVRQAVRLLLVQPLPARELVSKRDLESAFVELLARGVHAAVQGGGDRRVAESRSRPRTWSAGTTP